jgi:predicted nucleic acid-binding protein
MPQNYVLDATVIMEHLINGTYTQYADRLFALKSPLDGFYVPEFCLLECTNVLWKQVRFQSMSPKDADELCDDLIDLPLQILPITGVLNRALEIGLLHQLAVYDSVYIALAEKLNYPLITVDNRQEQAAKAVSVTIKPITDF